MKKSYKQPELKTFGSVRELTMALNKVGTATDVFSGQTNLCGSISPAAR